MYPGGSVPVHAGLSNRKMIYLLDEKPERVRHSRCSSRGKKGQSVYPGGAIPVHVGFRDRKRVLLIGRNALQS